MKEKKDIKDTLAFFFSALFSPYLVIPFFTAFLVYFYSPNFQKFLIWGFVCILFSTVVPYIGILIRVKQGKITDIHIAMREQRGEPFIIALSSIFIGTVVLGILKAPREIVILGVIMLANGVIFAIVTRRWKISLHISIFTASVVSAMILFHEVWGFFLLFLPPLIWSRIRRERHTAAQGVAGAILAVFITLTVFFAAGFIGRG